MTTRKSDLSIGLMCGLATALIWSGWSVATRFAVTTTLGPHDVTFLRFGVSALFLWPIIAKNGLALSKAGAGKLFVMIAGAGIPFMLLASIGVQFAPASHIATLMIGAMPIFVALLSSIFSGDRFSRPQICGLVSVVLGVGLIGGVSLLSNRSSREWRGDALFLFCGFLFASYTVAQRRSGISPWHATALVNVTSAVLFAPVYFLVLQPKIMTAKLEDVVLQVIAQGIGVAILGMVFYAEAVRRLGAPRAAIFGALVPAFAALIGVLVLGEIPPVSTIIGIALVMGGVILVVRTGATRLQRPSA